MYGTPKSPKGGKKRDFAVLPVKVNFCQKKSAAKFICVKTSSRCKIVATSFLYRTVHRWIVGDVPIYLKFALTPSQNADFDRFRLIVPQPWKLAKKLIIANRKSTMRFPSSHRWTLWVTRKSTKRWLETRIVTFCVAFHFFVAGKLNRRDFKLGMWVEYSMFQPTDDKPFLKWAWPRHVTYLKYYPPPISLELLKLETSNLVYMLIIASPSLPTTNYPWKRRGLGHVTSLPFGK